MMAPAHFPVRKPQHPDAQSLSLVQAPVMNWVPAAWGVGARRTLRLVMPPVKPRARPALSLGVPEPKPQPPSRWRAMMAPAHLPVVKPQQPEAQAASLVQAPVMNCVPWAVTWRATEEGLVRGLGQ
jgi:hypothetical protein